MAIVLITALLVVIMLGLSFLSYLSENNLLDDTNAESKQIYRIYKLNFKWGKHKGEIEFHPYLIMHRKLYSFKIMDRYNFRYAFQKSLH